MTTVTVFRRVAPPIIGVCGVVPDRESEAFEQTLDWIETTGVLVERYEPASAAGELAGLPNVLEALSRAGDRCLPLILVDGVITSSGRKPSRSELARMVGLSRSHGAESDAVRHQPVS